MNKKKLVSLCLVLALLVTAAVGATFAYFTDTDNATNTFTFGDVEIKLVEENKDGTPFTQGQVLVPGSKTENNIAKIVKVENTGREDAFMWIEVWVPSALDDGDDNSPAAPGLGNSLHFNYNGANVTETKATYLGSKEINRAMYNGYVHYAKDGAAIKPEKSTIALLDQVYMDAAVSQCKEGDKDCLVLPDKNGTHYKGSWDLVINAVGFQADGFTMEEAITTYYGKDVTKHIW